MINFSGDVIINNRYARNLSSEFNIGIWGRDDLTLTQVRKRAYALIKTRKRMGNGVKIYSTYGKYDPIDHSRKMTSIGVVFCRDGKIYYRKLVKNGMVAYVLHEDGSLGRKVGKDEIIPWQPTNYVYGL